MLHPPHMETRTWISLSHVLRRWDFCIFCSCSLWIQRVCLWKSVVVNLYGTSWFYKFLPFLIPFKWCIIAHLKDLNVNILKARKRHMFLKSLHACSCLVYIRSVICYDTIIWCLMFVTLLNELSYRQDKRMDELNLFIDYHAKYIVSIIWARPSLLFTCPTLTGVSPATSPIVEAARTLLHIM